MTVSRMLRQSFGCTPSCETRETVVEDVVHCTAFFANDQIVLSWGTYYARAGETPYGGGSYDNG